jgi:hypothetical protein
MPALPRQALILILLSALFRFQAHIQSKRLVNLNTFFERWLPVDHPLALIPCLPGRAWRRQGVRGAGRPTTLSTDKTDLHPGLALGLAGG